MSSFCNAKATHIFSAKNIRILYIDSTKTVNEMTLNKLVANDALNNWAPDKISADDILKYFAYFPQKVCFEIACKLSPLETVCMQCQSLFSEKNKENISLSSA